MSGQDTAAALATVAVSADGTDWRDVSAPLLSVDVEDHDRLTDKTVLVLEDQTGVLAHASFEGLRVRVGMGWQAEHAVVFEGVVAGAKVVAQPSGQRIELTALDFTYLMTRTPYDPATWKPGESLSTVLKRIVGRPAYAIPASRIEPADDLTLDEKRPVRYAGGNEWEFILDQAARQGCLAFVEFDGAKNVSTFYFVPIATLAGAAPVGTLRQCRGTGELVEFTYERTSASAPATTARSSIDPVTGAPVEEQAPAPPPRPPVPAPATAPRRDLDAERRAAVEALTEQAAAADKKIEPRRTQVTGRAAAAVSPAADPTRERGLRGRGVAVGTVRLRAKSMVKIVGVAPWAEGNWYVNQVNHRYTRERAGSGTRPSYHCTFTATR